MEIFNSTIYISIAAFILMNDLLLILILYRLIVQLLTLLIEYFCLHINIEKNSSKIPLLHSFQSYLTILNI